MTKTASLMVLVGIVAFGGGCGSSDGDDDAAGGDSGGGSGATASQANPRDTAGGLQSQPGSDTEDTGADEPDPRDTPEDVEAPPSDAIVSSTGLASKVLQPGTGSIHPSPADTVRVQYSGWTTDGMLFDSSYNKGMPAQFELAGVIRGWTEGLQLMVEGEIRRFWIPPALAYGENPAAGRPRGALTFDVELLDILPER